MKIKVETEKLGVFTLIWAHLVEFTDYVEKPDGSTEIVMEFHRMIVAKIYDGRICFEQPVEMYDTTYKDLCNSINEELIRQNNPDNDPEYWKWIKKSFCWMDY